MLNLEADGWQQQNNIPGATTPTGSIGGWKNAAWSVGVDFSCFIGTSNMNEWIILSCAVSIVQKQEIIRSNWTWCTEFSGGIWWLDSNGPAQEKSLDTGCRWRWRLGWRLTDEREAETERRWLHGNIWKGEWQMHRKQEDHWTRPVMSKSAWQCRKVGA